MSHRTFHDDVGSEWDVWEVHPSLTDRRLLADRRAIRRDSPPERRVGSDTPVETEPDLRRGWLAFRRPFERRRLAPVPAGWDDLDDRALIGLLTKARLRSPRFGEYRG